MSAELPQRVLIVRLGAIGDVTNALVVATAIKDSRPDVEIGWAVHELALPLVEGHPSVDRVHLWRRGGGWAGLRRFVAELRAHDYGLAIDLQRIQKSSFVARRSGAPRVLGFDRARSKELSWIWTTERIAPADRHAHMVEQYMGFVRALGIEASPRLVLPTDPEADAWADELVGRLGEAPILIGVGASKPENRWPAERFAHLAWACVERFGLPVCLCGGPGDRDLFAAALERTADHDTILDLVGRTSLRQLIALEARARLFVGCDTGPMHLAVASGTRVVALFGPADPRRTGPYGPEHAVVRADGGAMRTLAIEPVLAAVETALDAAPRASVRET